MHFKSRWIMELQEPRYRPDLPYAKALVKFIKSTHWSEWKQAKKLKRWPQALFIMNKETGIGIGLNKASLEACGMELKKKDRKRVRCAIQSILGDANRTKMASKESVK